MPPKPVFRCASLPDDARLYDVGVASRKVMPLRNLRNRLGMQRDFAAHPEICVLEHSLRTPCFLGWGSITGRLNRLSTRSMTARARSPTTISLSWR
jgi:hypothetical protein